MRQTALRAATLVEQGPRPCSVQARITQARSSRQKQRPAGGQWKWTQPAAEVGLPQRGAHASNSLLIQFCRKPRTTCKQCPYARVAVTGASGSRGQARAPAGQDDIASHLLKPHQQRVVDAMMSLDTSGAKGLLVMHGMGTGKTLTATEVIKALLREGKDVQHVVILARKNTIATWTRHRDARLPQELHPKVVISSHDAWLKDRKAKAASTPLDIPGAVPAVNKPSKAKKQPCLPPDIPRNVLLVVDEVHNMRGNNSQRAMNFVAACATPNVTRVLLLTGTPMVNGPEDLINLALALHGMPWSDRHLFLHKRTPKAPDICTSLRRWTDAHLPAPEQTDDMPKVPS